MSGPVAAADTEVPRAQVETAVVDVTERRASQVGAFTVRRALPRRNRRTVGASCFVDHIGPATAGEAVHRDSLGNEQVIVPGQLNLMTAGHGVSHSEEGTGRHGNLHGVQLWVAQPSTTRDTSPAILGRRRQEAATNLRLSEEAKRLGISVKQLRRRLAQRQ